jgi:hypothetical protein
MAPPSSSMLVSGLIQRKSDGGNIAIDADAAIAGASHSSGDALPGDLREKFESSLGTDLSSVRIHTGAESQAAASAVAARAYALGNDVHFADGQYDPHSSAGQHLIAHEVAHTVQQRGGSPTRQDKLAVSEASDALEIEADRAADAMIVGAPARVSNGGVAIARKGDDKKGGGDASAAPTFDKNAITQKLSFSFKTPSVAVSKIKCEAQGEVKVAGQLTLSPTSDAEQDKKASAAEAMAAGKDLARKHFDADAKPDGVIESVDYELVEKKAKPSPKLENGSGKLEASFAPTVKLKLRGGAEVAVGVTILQLEQGADGLKVEVGTIKASESLPLYTIPDGTLWNGFKVTGDLKLEFEFTLKPDKAAIAAELVQRFGPQLLAKSGLGTAGGMVGTAAKAAAEIMGSLPAMVGIAGAYITVKSTLASLGDARDIKNVAAAAERAVQGYAGGFSGAVGGKKVAGDPAWNAQGAADGARMLDDQIAKVAQALRARAAAEGFAELSPDEIRAVMMERIGGEAREIYDAVYTGAGPRIKEAYVKAWRDNLSTWQKLFTNTESDERYLRTRMGVAKKAGDKPTAAAPMPEGADTGLPPPEAEAE